MSRRRAKPPELRVFLDSSAIFTTSASDLLRVEVVKIIGTQSNFPDLKVVWYLPEIVIEERRYQMRQRALDLLPNLAKLERLLGHNLGITPETLDARVDDAIKRQTDALGIAIQPLAPGRVVWPDLVRAAVFREPPFQAGEKEKGFRDAIVAETFTQLVEDSPKTPKVCRLALVAGDNLLRAAVEERTKGATNVRVFEGVEQLTELINTLVSNVDEAFVAGLVPKAEKLFYVSEKAATLYYSAKLRERLEKEFKAQLNEIPAGASWRRNDPSWHLAVPRFVRKAERRVFWVSTFLIDSTAFAYATTGTAQGLQPGTPLSSTVFTSPPNLPNAGSLWSMGGYAGKNFVFDTNVLTSKNLDLQTIAASMIAKKEGFENYKFTFPPEEKEVAKGRTTLEVEWSANVAVSKTLSGPRVEEIRFVETTWD